MYEKKNDILSCVGLKARLRSHPQQSRELPVMHVDT